MTTEIDYYEPMYDKGLCGIKRYCSNLGKQTRMVPSMAVIAFAMAIIEIIEFLATMKLVPLITEAQYDWILAWTLYTYAGLFVIKFLDLGWLCFVQWDTKNIGFAGKLLEFAGLWTFSCFLPYGEFFVDLGYKMFAVREAAGQ